MPKFSLKKENNSTALNVNNNSSNSNLILSTHDNILPNSDFDFDFSKKAINNESMAKSNFIKTAIDSLGENFIKGILEKYMEQSSVIGNKLMKYNDAKYNNEHIPMLNSDNSENRNLAYYNSNYSMVQNNNTGKYDEDNLNYNSNYSNSNNKSNLALTNNRNNHNLNSFNMLSSSNSNNKYGANNYNNISYSSNSNNNFKLKNQTSLFEDDQKNLFEISNLNVSPNPYLDEFNFNNNQPPISNIFNSANNLLLANKDDNFINSIPRMVSSNLEENLLESENINDINKNCINADINNNEIQTEAIFGNSLRKSSFDINEIFKNENDNEVKKFSISENFFNDNYFINNNINNDNNTDNNKEEEDEQNIKNNVSNFKNDEK